MFCEQLAGVEAAAFVLVNLAEVVVVADAWVFVVLDLTVVVDAKVALDADVERTFVDVVLACADAVLALMAVVVLVVVEEEAAVAKNVVELELGVRVVTPPAEQPEPAWLAKRTSGYLIPALYAPVKSSKSSAQIIVPAMPRFLANITLAQIDSALS